MRNSITLAAIILIVCTTCMFAQQPQPETTMAAETRDVIVTVGDSITDANTYQQIARQALVEAGKPAPVIVCAGTVCDTSVHMRDRFRSTVLVMKPAIVTFTAGTNDAVRNMTVDQYEQALMDVVKMCKDAKVKLIFMTPCIINETAEGKVVRKHGKDVAHQAEETTKKYVAVMEKIAAGEKLTIARNYERQAAARKDGQAVMSSDGIHPNYHGQLLMTRALLDALGYGDVALPKEFKPEAFPGAATRWKMRARPQVDGQPQPLSETMLEDLKFDDSWQDYDQAQAKPRADSAEDFFEQLRRNGYGFSSDLLPDVRIKQAVATVQSEKDKQAYVHVSMCVTAVFVNGKQVSQKVVDDNGEDRIAPVHVGGSRWPVKLKKGANTIAIEINGNDFCVLVSDDFVWEKSLK